MISSSEFADNYHRLWLATLAAVVIGILGGCDDSKVKYASNLKLNVLSKLPETISDARMVSSDGNEIPLGYLSPNNHSFIQSPFTFPITREWAFHWTEGDEQYSSTFLIAPAILEENPIPLQVTIHPDRTVHATRYTY